MPLRNKIFLVDPRGNFNFDDADVLERHNSYLKEYERKFSEPLEIIVLGIVTNSFTEAVRGYAVSSRTRNFIKFALLSAKFVKNHNSPVLVASDPWFSFLSCLAIKRLINPKTIIQLQLHGQYLKGHPMRLRNIAIKTYIQWGIKKTDQTRFVNMSEYKYFMGGSTMKVQEKAFFAPVPLNKVFLENIPKLSPPRPLTIGFVGRIQSERGLPLFIKVAGNLKRALPELRAIVVGTGPDREIFKKSLKESFEGDLLMLDYLTPTELKSQMANIGVLLSCAPRESYGRAMREAVLSGVPVLAIRSDGALSLRNSLPEACFQLFEKKESHDEILKKFNQLLKSGYSPAELVKNLGLDSPETSKLIESWHQLIHR
jgi:glycosyltransferase involved in cell wall biosynthesis